MSLRMCVGTVFRPMNGSCFRALLFCEASSQSLGRSGAVKIANPDCPLKAEHNLVGENVVVDVDIPPMFGQEFSLRQYLGLGHLGELSSASAWAL